MNWVLDDSISKYRFCMSCAATSRLTKAVYGFIAIHSEKRKEPLHRLSSANCRRYKKQGHVGLRWSDCLPYIAQIALLLSGVISCVAATQEQQHLHQIRGEAHACAVECVLINCPSRLVGIRYVVATTTTTGKIVCMISISMHASKIKFIVIYFSEHAVYFFYNPCHNQSNIY